MPVRCRECGTTVEVRRRGHCPICGAPVHAPDPAGRSGGSDEFELDESDVLDDLELLEEVTESPSGVWSDGRYLVMWKDAELPDICVKSNQPANGGRLRRKLYWHHPAVFLAVCAGVLIYVILALVLRKSASIEIGLSDEWFRRRGWAIAVGWFLALLGIAVAMCGVLLIEVEDDLAWLVPGGLLLAFFGAVYGMLKARMVAPIRITDEYVWLKGVHPDYLDALPQYTGPRF